MASIKGFGFDFTDPNKPILEITTNGGPNGDRYVNDISFTIAKRTYDAVNMTYGQSQFLAPIYGPLAFNVIDSSYTGTNYNTDVKNSLSIDSYNSGPTDTITNDGTGGTGLNWCKISGYTNETHTKTRINLMNLFTTGNPFVSGNKFSVHVRINETMNSNPASTWTWAYNVNSFNSVTVGDFNQYTTYMSGNTSDITTTASTSTTNSSADWGYNYVSSGFALVGIHLPATMVTNQLFLKLLDSNNNQINMPEYTKAILAYTREVSYTNDTPPIAFNSNLDSNNLGTLGINRSIYLTDVIQSATNYVKLLIAIPVSGSGLTVGSSYALQILNSSSNVIATTGAPAVLSCLYEDTEVLTKSGYVSVKQLKEGDEIITSDGRTSKIVKLMISKLPASYRNSPLIIKANSITENYPPKDCRISKYHMIQYNGEWITPYKNEHIFKADESIRSIKYYHIQLENFKTDHLVINGGLIVECLCDNDLSNENEWNFRYNNSIIL